MAKVEWVEARLCQWARWRLARDIGATGFASTNVLGRWWEPPNNREPSARIPIDETEAFVTDQAVRQLDERLRSTVEQHYLTSGSVIDDASSLGCAVSTVHARITEAHGALRTLLEARDPRRSPDTPGFYEL